MFDFYAIPNDFPGYEEAKIVEPYACVNALEQSVSNAVNDKRFIRISNCMSLKLYCFVVLNILLRCIQNVSHVASN